MTIDRTEAARSRRRLTATVTDLEVARQRAYLVGVVPPRGDLSAAESSLEELALLTDTAGSEPVEERSVRMRTSFDPATFVGSGMAQILAEEARALDVDVVVFDNDLAPAQQRNLQSLFDCDVVDRVALILDIFAQHASSREGRIQVELALLRYHLPRLRGRGIELSRLGGGIGTRGPGETKLETDRRRILDRITRLEREIKHLRTTRATQRKARSKAEYPVVALVGYTNAGKSTMLNQLTGAGVLVEDRLFSTLDSTVRRFEMANGRTVLLSDTVGFVRRLPHQLVEAFRSTLTEISEADLLLHIVNAADAEAEGQIAAVREVLHDIDASEVPELLVLNKADVAPRVALGRLRQLHPESVVASALEGTGTSELEEAVVDALTAVLVEVKVEIPYERGDLLAALHRHGELLVEEHGDEGTLVVARVPTSQAPLFEKFAV